MTKVVSPGALRAWLAAGKAVLVDVREPAEYASDHIEGSVLLPLGTLSRDALPDLQNHKLVIHCRKGGRGANACHKLLHEMPGIEIYNLEGGIEAWENAGFPVRRSGRKMLPLDRQVQLTIGLFVLAGSFLGYFRDPAYFLLSGFFGAGLTFAGLSGFCGLARLVALMPWNHAPQAS
jgi:rhodanese-related sulfurtransferase